jgi:outer membrane biosynthesis protein TonB
MVNQFTFERENHNKGMRISVILHALLLLIAFFYFLPQLDKEASEDKPPYAVKVDFSFEESSMSKFAHEDVGAKRPKAEAAQQIEATKPQELDVPKPEIKVPTPVMTPTPAEPVISKTVEDEAPVKVTEVKTEAPKAEPVKETPKSEPVKETPKETATTKPTTTTTTGSGTSTTKPSTTDGKDGGTGKGDSGTGAGSSKGDDGDSGLGNASDGTGAYDGSGDGIFGRKVIYRDLAAAKAAMSVSGVVAIKVCVNRAGIVTFTEPIFAETTIKDKTIIKKYMSAAKNYKFAPNLSAPKEECGKLTFKPDNTINNKVRN